MTLENLKEQLLLCQKCRELTEFRTKVALPYGTGQNKIMFIGEAPSYVGGNLSGNCWIGKSKSGRFMQEILEESNIIAEDCYFTNLCFCSPPQNRKPTKEEINNCSSYKEEEFNIINPNLIILLGSTPAEFFIGKTFQRNKTYVIKNRNFISILHPAFILRNERFGNTVMSDSYKTSFRKILENAIQSN
jgi:DNA polymerase